MAADLMRPESELEALQVGRSMSQNGDACVEEEQGRQGLTAAPDIMMMSCDEMPERNEAVAPPTVLHTPTQQLQQLHVDGVRFVSWKVDAAGGRMEMEMEESDETRSAAFDSGAVKQQQQQQQQQQTGSRDDPPCMISTVVTSASSTSLPAATAPVRDFMDEEGDGVKSVGLQYEVLRPCGVGVVEGGVEHHDHHHDGHSLVLSQRASRVNFLKVVVPSTDGVVDRIVGSGGAAGAAAGAAGDEEAEGAAAEVGRVRRRDKWSGAEGMSCA